MAVGDGTTIEPRPDRPAAERRLVRVAADEPCPLPENPVLAAWAATLNEVGQWAEIVDHRWRCVYLTDDARRIYGGRVEMVPFTLGAFTYGPERLEEAMAWRGGQFPLEIFRRALLKVGPWMLADAPGGRDELRTLVDPRLADLVDELSPVDFAHATSYILTGMYTAAGAGVDILTSVLRVRDEAGRVVGTVAMSKPAIGMAAVARMTSLGDRRHFERMETLARPARRPAAVLFADLENSSRLARRLSTAGYFSLVRRIARAADESVIEAGGLPGQHAGDGVVAFFLAETAGSESAAARNCVTAARRMSEAMLVVAARSDLDPDDVVLRFGLHWGANLYVGQIATAGRTEVTALGDQVNETARIEACATGGRTLASKDLVERLDDDDARALELTPDYVTYTPLGELGSATEKARRDAPAIAVCEV
jgi:class 3 adenylate cyclase